MASSVHAQTVTVDGVLTSVWGDPLEADGHATLVWTHRDDAGVERFVTIAGDVLEAAGGYFAVNGRRVSLTASAAPGAVPAQGGLAPGPVWQATSLRSLAPLGPVGAPAAAPRLGSRPYAAILCKFSDVAAEPISPSAVAGLFSATRPGLDHYYREISDDQMDLAGTQAFGWFTLPSPKSAYVTADGADLTRMATDCTAAADAAVDFSRFSGITAQFNAPFTTDGSSGFAWGGARFMTLDGVARVWPFTWMPLWATGSSRYGGYAHEIGHSLGLPHSSGPYSATYDSSWDVMSDAYLTWTGSYWTPPHTIVPHRDALGWIPSNRKRTVSVGEETLVLDQAQFPPAGSNPLMVTVPIPFSSSSYVIESRQLLGYDAGLPGAAVIIHEVTGACDLISVTCARVVDVDGDGDPNDDGAMWLPGETFSGEGGVEVRVNSETANGWNITVTPGDAATCTLTLNASAGGTLALTDGTLSGACGRSVTVTAIPSGGFGFGAWSTGATANPYTFTLDSDLALSATFVAECALTLQQTTGGTVALTSGTLTGTCGRSVTVEATPNGDFRFGSWSTGATTNPLSMTVTRSVTLSATFIGQCALTLQQTAGGTIALTAGAATGDCGRSVTVSATPAADFALSAWSNGGSANPFTFELTGDLTLSATFVRQCALSLEQTSGGTIALAAGTLTGDCGRSVTVAATAAANHLFRTWSTGAATNPLTFELDEDLTLSATFVRQCTLTLVQTSGGTLALSAGTATGDCGRSVTVTATPNPGWTFTGWSDGQTANPSTFVVDENRSLSGAFALICTLTLSQASGGTLAITTGSATGVCGRSVTVRATPDGGQIFLGWSDGSYQNPRAVLVSETSQALGGSFTGLQRLASAALDALLAGDPGVLTRSELEYLDATGNANGFFDLGDLLAFLDRNPGVTFGAGAMGAAWATPGARSTRIPLGPAGSPGGDR